MVANLEATIEDLYAVPGNRKAEIVNGEIVTMSPTGAAPSYAASEIFASLREYSRRTKKGIAVTDNAAFGVDLPNRKSFSPDAAFYTGKWTGMKFFEGAPLFAVEVRSGKVKVKRISATPKPKRWVPPPGSFNQHYTPELIAEDNQMARRSVQFDPADFQA